MPYKLVCPDCQSEYHVEKSGVLVIEMASFGPYKVWDADLLECYGCHKTIISGFGSEPLMEHYEPGFKDWLEDIKVAYLKAGSYIIYDYEHPALNLGGQPHERDQIV